MALSTLDILSCRITVGDADPANPIVIKNGIELSEVQQIQITESYKKLIGTAKVTFPKGTVYKSTIIGPVTAEGVDATRLTTEVMQDGVLIEQIWVNMSTRSVFFNSASRYSLTLFSLPLMARRT